MGREVSITRVAIVATADANCFMCDGEGWLSRQTQGPNRWKHARTVPCDCVTSAPPAKTNEPLAKPTPVPQLSTEEVNRIVRDHAYAVRLRPERLDEALLHAHSELDITVGKQMVYCEQAYEGGPYEVAVCSEREGIEGAVTVRWEDPVLAKRALLDALYKLREGRIPDAEDEDDDE